MKTKNIVAPLAAGIVAISGLSWWLGHRGGSIDPLLESEPQVWKWRDHDIHFAVAGEGEPVVLIHALYPGASNAQWANNFSALSKQFKVFAPDLIGFGASERPMLDYTPELYTDLISDFLKEVVGSPAVVIAGGQSAPFVVDVAAAEPDLVKRLALSSPTGLTRMADAPPLRQRILRGWASLPVVGTLTYFVMVSKWRTARLLKNQAVEDPTLITPNAVNNIYRETHQPGAKWAPLAILGGRLNDNVRESYAMLKQPILILWGDMPSYIPATDAQEWLDANENAVLREFPDARFMPEFEHSAKFNAHVEMWTRGKLAA